MLASYLILLLGLGSIFVFLPDLFRNPETVQNITSFSSGFLASVFAFIALAVRLFCPNPVIGKLKSSLLLASSLILLFTASILAFLNFSIHPNFVYSHTLLNTDKLLFISLSSGFLWLLLQKNTFYYKNFNKILITLPMLLVFISIIMFLWPLNAMSKITREDGLVEIAQVIVLIFGSISAVRVAKKAVKLHIFFCVMYVLVALLLFVIAGDEISWGQRLLGLQTPSQLQSINRQEEITLHNIHTFDGLVPYAYIMIGLYGSVIAMIIRMVQRPTPLINFFVPEKWYFFLFFFPLLYNGYTSLFDHKIGNFSEPMELILYLGIALFIFGRTMKMKKSKKA